MFVIKLKKPPKKILLCIISPQRTLSKKFPITEKMVFAFARRITIK